MPRGLIVDQAADFVSAGHITTSTAAASFAFTPADGPQAYNGFPTALIASAITLRNEDATNAVWVRLQLASSEVVSLGIKYGSAGTGGQSIGQPPVSVDSSKFIAATAGTKGELFLAPGQSLTLNAKAVGLSVVAVAGTPIVDVYVVGGLYNVT